MMWPFRRKKEEYPEILPPIPETTKKEEPYLFPTPSLPPIASTPTQAQAHEISGDLRKDLELISTKLEMIKIQLERLDQRLTIIEKMISERY